jgi:hypothetical protein
VTAILDSPVGYTGSPNRSVIQSDVGVRTTPVRTELSTGKRFKYVSDEYRVPKSSTDRCRPRLRSSRSAELAATASYIRVVSEISSQSESAAIPVEPSASRTVTTKSGSMSCRVATLTERPQFAKRIAPARRCASCVSKSRRTDTPRSTIGSIAEHHEFVTAETGQPSSPCSTPRKRLAISRST